MGLDASLQSLLARTAMYLLRDIPPPCFELPCSEHEGSSHDEALGLALELTNAIQDIRENGDIEDES